MGDQNEQRKVVCSFGFDDHRVASRLEITVGDVVLEASEFADEMVLMQNMTGGGFYCAGHRYVTPETLSKFEPDHEQTGARINEDGVLVNLHGLPICRHCKRYKG